MSNDTEVRVAEDIERTIIGPADATDTSRVGAIRSGAGARAVFGSLPATAGTEVDRRVGVARGRPESAVSIREALQRRQEV